MLFVNAEGRQQVNEKWAYNNRLEAEAKGLLGNKPYMNPRMQQQA